MGKEVTKFALKGPDDNGVFLMTFIGSKEHRLTEETFKSFHETCDKVDKYDGGPPGPGDRSVHVRHVRHGDDGAGQGVSP